MPRRIHTHRAAILLSWLFLLGIFAIGFLLSCAGCTAFTDPATGKVTQKFDADKAQAIINSPEVAAGAGALPYGLGGLVVAGASILVAVLGKQSKDKHQATADVITHAVTAVASSVQADSGLTVKAADAATPAPTPTPKP